MAVALLFAAGAARAEPPELPTYFLLSDAHPSVAPYGPFEGTFEVQQEYRFPLDPNRCERGYNGFGQLVFEQCGRRITEYAYNAFGQVISTIRRRGPPLPAFARETRRLGEVSLSGSLAPFAMSACDVAADDRNASEATAALPPGRLLPLRPAAQRGAAFIVPLDDGSSLRLALSSPGYTGETEVGLSVDAGTTLRGPLRQHLAGPGSRASSRRTTFIGVVSARNDPRPLEFSVAWQDGANGDVTFVAPTGLVGVPARIRRSNAGAFSVTSPATRALRIRIQPDGSGWYDLGFGRESFPEGAMRTATAEAAAATDAADPADDVSSGATELVPSAGGVTETRTLSRADRHDWFRIDVAQGALYVFDAAAGCEAGGTRLDLYDAANELIATGERGRIYTPALEAGTYFVDVQTAAPGSAYALSWTTVEPGAGAAWTASGTLGPPADLEDDERFGAFFAVSGPSAVIGAPSEGQGRGAAYVFEREAGTWMERARLEPPASLAPATEFGTSIAISGDVVLMGASGADSRRGAVYVYDATSPAAPRQRLVASPRRVNEDFGSSVAIAGGFAFVGAPTAASAGSVHVFARSGNQWVARQRIPWPDAAEDAAGYFGYTLATDGERLVVGAPRSGQAILRRASAAVPRRSLGGTHARRVRQGLRLEPRAVPRLLHRSPGDAGGLHRRQELGAVRVGRGLQPGARGARSGRPRTRIEARRAAHGRDADGGLDPRVVLPALRAGSEVRRRSRETALGRHHRAPERP